MRVVYLVAHAGSLVCDSFAQDFVASPPRHLVDPAIEVQETLFVVGQKGNNSCPTGSKFIDTATTCIEFADTIDDKHFEKEVKWKGSPKGCFFKNNKIYFNRHQIGGTRRKETPVCEVISECDPTRETCLVDGELGDSICPGDSDPITEDLCKDYAERHASKTWKRTVSTGNKPTGCYYFPSGSVFFNTRPEGKGNSKTTPVCGIRWHVGDRCSKGQITALEQPEDTCGPHPSCPRHQCKEAILVHTYNDNFDCCATSCEYQEAICDPCPFGYVKDSFGCNTCDCVPECSAATVDENSTGCIVASCLQIPEGCSDIPEKNYTLVDGKCCEDPWCPQCPPQYCMTKELWSEEKRAWCCENQGRGCAADLCDDWQWPPNGTRFCSSDKECDGEEECAGCTPSCWCDPDSGKSHCARDCRSTCQPKPARQCDFAMDEEGTQRCRDDPDCFLIGGPPKYDTCSGGCPCGEPCEQGSFSGVCQVDGQTCAVNIRPPDCPSPSCDAWDYCCPDDYECLLPRGGSGKTCVGPGDQISKPTKCDRCKDWEWPPAGTKFCSSTKECGDGEYCEPTCTSSSCSCDPQTGNAGFCTFDCRSTCQPKKCCEALTVECLSCASGLTVEEYCVQNPNTSGCPTKPSCESKGFCCPLGYFCGSQLRGGRPSCLGPADQVAPPTQECPDATCSDWQWPPVGTRFCSSARDCADGEDCGGCTASSCTCDPNTGKAGICTSDCRFTCHERKMCCMALTAECLSCAAGLTVEEYCMWNPSTVGCPTQPTCETEGYCCPPGYSCGSQLRGGRPNCLGPSDQVAPPTQDCPDVTCRDWQWPPVGTHFCSSARDCEDGEECGGCTASSCACDPITGEAGICTLDCRSTCQEKMACCMSLTAECLSCSAGLTVEEYCAQNPDTDGCCSKFCCHAIHAQCESCKACLSLEDYCEQNPGMLGCPQKLTCETVGYCCPKDYECTLPRGGGSKQCVGQDGSVAVPTAVGCCADFCCEAFTAECEACKACSSLEEYCAQNPDMIGCPKEPTCETDGYCCPSGYECVIPRGGDVKQCVGHGDSIAAPTTDSCCADFCCEAITAECESCKACQSVEDYCAKNPDMFGCPKSRRCCPFGLGAFPANPVCREGCACCPDGTWVGSWGDGQTFTCSDVPWNINDDANKFGVECEAELVNCKMCPHGYYDGCNDCKCTEDGHAVCDTHQCIRPVEPFCLVEPSICDMPKIVGPCEGAMKRWYFNSKLGVCQEFVYGGCHGNRNNFETLDECMMSSRSCNGAPCLLANTDEFDESASHQVLSAVPFDCPMPPCARPPPGCHYQQEQKTHGYYMNGHCCPNPSCGILVCPKPTNCRICPYGYNDGCNDCVCGKDGQSVCTMHHCVRHGDPFCLEEPSICDMPKELGLCEHKTDIVMRFYFDSGLNKCLEFSWGGCHKNSNNFETLDQCIVATSRCDGAPCLLTSANDVDPAPEQPKLPASNDMESFLPVLPPLRPLCPVAICMPPPGCHYESDSQGFYTNGQCCPKPCGKLVCKDGCDGDHVCQLTCDVPECKCGENEEMKLCGPCDSTCERSTLCMAVCNPQAAACGCISDHVRDASGKCIPQVECPELKP